MPGNAPDWNWLAAETGILDRLKGRLQAGGAAWAREVAGRETLASVAEEMQNCPAVYVIYDGYAILDANEQQAHIALRFLAVLAIADATQGKGVTPRNQSASLFIGDIFSALHGYRPPECITGLVPVTPPRPYYAPARFAYFPSAWETRLIHSTRQGPIVSRRQGQA
jgi:hypothetical protein